MYQLSEDLQKLGSLIRNKILQLKKENEELVNNCAALRNEVLERDAFLKALRTDIDNMKASLDGDLESELLAKMTLDEVSFLLEAAILQGACKMRCNNE